MPVPATPPAAGTIEPARNAGDGSELPARAERDGQIAADTPGILREGGQGFDQAGCLLALGDVDRERVPCQQVAERPGSSGYGVGGAVPRRGKAVITQSQPQGVCAAGPGESVGEFHLPLPRGARRAGDDGADPSDPNPYSAAPAAPAAASGFLKAAARSTG